MLSVVSKPGFGSVCLSFSGCSGFRPLSNRGLGVGFYVCNTWPGWGDYACLFAYIRRTLYIRSQDGVVQTPGSRDMMSGSSIFIKIAADRDRVELLIAEMDQLLPMYVVQ